MVHYTPPSGFCKEFSPETDKSTGRDIKFYLYISGTMSHIKHFGFAPAEVFDYRPHGIFGYVDNQVFHWFH